VQPLVAEPALRKLDKLSLAGNKQAADLATYWVGQAVGLMNETKSAGEVVQDFKTDFIEAYERLNGALEEA
jgi:NAD(P)H-dependent flavin oxidoreductase YrpB (nitropropane dioxygenase family)